MQCHARTVPSPRRHDSLAKLVARVALPRAARPIPRPRIAPPAPVRGFTGRAGGAGVAHLTCVAVCAVVLGCGGGKTLDDHWGTDVRSSDPPIQLFQPIGDVDVLPDYFLWSTATAASYAVAILDAEGTVLWKAEGLPAPSSEVSMDVRAVIQPGVEYGWQVLAVENAGDVRAGSAVGKFRLRAAGTE